MTCSCWWPRSWSWDADRCPRPDFTPAVCLQRYEPSKKEGAIVLGVGGDNSPWGAGTFFEGVMTKGVSSSATDAAVVANVVAAGYSRH